MNKWQQKHEVKLIELLKPGSRETDVMKNKTEYKKSEYRFAALAKIAEAYSGNATDLQAVVKYTIEELRKDFVPDEPKKKYHPNHLIRKAKKTIYTKLGKIFELGIELGEEPYYRCKAILDECSDILNFMDSKYKLQRNRDSFIADFEREYGLSEMTEVEKNIND